MLKLKTSLTTVGVAAVTAALFMLWPAADNEARATPPSWIVAGAPAWTVHPLTRKPTDGSEEAKVTVAGLVEIVALESAVVIDVHRVTPGGSEPSTYQPVSYGTSTLVGGGTKAHAADVMLGDAVLRGAIKNQGPDTLVLTLANAQTGELSEHIVLPGDALMIAHEGMLEIFLSTHQLGCACQCRTGSAGPDFTLITLDCCPDDPCTCGCYENMPCLVSNGSGGFDEGQAGVCQKKLIPR